jgi:hypothetical protein
MIGLATQQLADRLIDPRVYPSLSSEEIAAARARLAEAFQVAHIEETIRLVRLESSCA